MAYNVGAPYTQMSLTMMHDAEMIRRLREGDPEALFLLYNGYRDRVCAVVRRVVRDEWDAEEVVQDVFWTVHRKIDMFREDSSLWSWMYRIAVNASKMHVRKYKRAAIPMEQELLLDLSARAESEPERFVGPEEQLMSRELVTHVQRYLEAVGDLNRQLYIELVVEGRSKEEVAAQLELTVPAVKTRLHRLRAGLQDHLSQLQQGP